MGDALMRPAASHIATMRKERAGGSRHASVACTTQDLREARLGTHRRTPPYVGTAALRVYEAYHHAYPCTWALQGSEERVQRFLDTTAMPAHVFREKYLQHVALTRANEVCLPPHSPPLKDGLLITHAVWLRAWVGSLSMNCG